MQKKITNEQLAEMIQRGFQETASRSYVDERFASMDERFVSIDERFASMDERFVSIDERFTSIDKRFDTLIDGMRLMQDDVHDIKITLSPLVRMVAAAETDIENLTMRVSRLEHKVGLKK